MLCYYWGNLRMVLQPGAIPDNQFLDIVGTIISPANSDHIFIYTFFLTFVVTQWLTNIESFGDVHLGYVPFPNHLWFHYKNSDRMRHFVIYRGNMNF